MIVFRFWQTHTRDRGERVERHWEGWFLLGFVPLFVRMTKEVRRW